MPLRTAGLDLSGALPQTALPPFPLNDHGPSPDQLTWQLSNEGQGVLEVRTPKTKIVVGHVDDRSIDLGHNVQLAIGHTLANWCAVALTILEGEAFDRAPHRALLVAAGITENTGQGWKDKAHTTVGRDWGRAPSLVEPIEATVQIPYDGGLPTVYSLDERGQRSRASMSEPSRMA